MRQLTRQDHIDPLISKVQKCGSSGCGPQSVQVFFTRPAGYIRDFDPVWVCSTGHCSDYDEIPSLRKPEDCPVTWIQTNAREVSRILDVEMCDDHKDTVGEIWGMGGHIWVSSHHQVPKLCLPQA